MGDKRAFVLDTARELFNRQGYGETTMRGIAEACGIAVGNLTYYYHTRSDLVAALMNDAFDRAMPSGEIETLSDLTEQFARMLETLEKNAFFFLDDLSLPNTGDHHVQIRARIMRGFGNLKEKQLFSAGFTLPIQEAVMDVLCMAHTSWLRERKRHGRGMSTAAFLREHWIILQPYLTQDGLTALGEEMQRAPLV
ncbi:MAG: TetR/AcrR family transcriptional regulator [Clostridia bacterium]|nr:TetR/AcrR family transcriptional regulator [Clostridia bacterium]MBR1684712.1 TetR/AcrR family transcriptional regulator [Clostridia bacterium]